MTAVNSRWSPYSGQGKCAACQDSPTWVIQHYERDTGVVRLIVLMCGDCFRDENNFEWLSQCCGKPPSEATPDIDYGNDVGVCAQCLDWTGFELAPAE